MRAKTAPWFGHLWIAISGVFLPSAIDDDHFGRHVCLAPTLEQQRCVFEKRRAAPELARPSSLCVQRGGERNDLRPRNDYCRHDCRWELAKLLKCFITRTEQTVSLSLRGATMLVPFLRGGIGPSVPTSLG